MREGKSLKLNCYVQEYWDKDVGQVSARLVERSTDKEVMLHDPSPELRINFAELLMQANAIRLVAPTALTKYGEGGINLKGTCVKETETSITMALK